MTTELAIRPRRSIAVTAIGATTLLLGLGYSFLGGVFLYSGVNAARDLHEDGAGGWEPFLQIIAGFVIAVGIAFGIPGVLAVFAGAGDLLRKQWGRVLTFVVAPLAVLWGIAFIALASGEMVVLILGAMQILYGFAALFVLIRYGREFSYPRNGDWD